MSPPIDWDAIEISPASAWPVLDAAALHGLAGEVVATISPHTESDPVGLLVDFLACFGSSVGSGPYAVADASEHPARLNVVLVGETSRSRKGTARANIRKLMNEADPGWSDRRVMGGLASGEGLIAAVADPTAESQGAADKRLLIVEPEFARLLGVAGREGSTLSPIVRDAWDTGKLRVMTRKDPLVATGAHVSILGHITREELRRRLSSTEAANGFANRFLFAMVRRSQLLPYGGDLDDSDQRALGAKVRHALERGRTIGLLRRTVAANDRWAELYSEMAEGDAGGLVGAITARPEAQTLRLSVAYALLDGSRTIDVEHLEAAYAVWRYCEASAAWIFGDALGDDVADQLLEGLRRAGRAGLDGTEQRDLFARHVSGPRLELARRRLEEAGLAETVSRPTGGRPRTVTYATATKATEATKGRP